MRFTFFKEEGGLLKEIETSEHASLTSVTLRGKELSAVHGGQTLIKPAKMTPKEEAEWKLQRAKQAAETAKAAAAEAARLAEEAAAEAEAAGVATDSEPEPEKKKRKK